MTTKARFLLRAIYALCGVVQAMLTTIGRRPAENYAHRDLGLHRVNAIVADLTALTTRIHPTRVGPEAFARLRPRPHTPADPRPADPHPADPRPAEPPAIQAPRQHRAARPLSARGLALRLDTLLCSLDRATAELGQSIPTSFARLAARIRTLAGCAALEPATPPRPAPTPATRTWADLVAEDWDPFIPHPVRL